ncbi:MAG: cytochrome P450 [Solirubrobacteraceae bacterium]|nr:cytochrome P450 [Solirubrobacteraceae bacterium]
MEGLPPRPDLGRFMMSAGFILRPTRFLDACHETCGDYFTLLPAKDRVIVTTADPAAVKQVFSASDDELRAGEANIILAPILGMRSVLLLDGPEHMRQRKLMLPPFHGERMRAYEEIMREVAQREVATWPRGPRFGALQSMQAITLEVIMRAVFGVDDAGERERLGAALRGQLDVLANPRRVMMLALTQGRMGARSPWVRFEAAQREADTLIYDQIRARRADPGTDREDIFSLLLAARDEDGEPLSDQELRDELMTLLVAGHETTATALAWTLERVTRHPEVLARLQAHPGDAEYIDAVMTESLRLRPVVPAVLRKLQKPMEFGGWQLPAGVNIALSIYLLHRRADLYPDPLAFMPERFLGKKPGTYEWIPFGGGIRRCLGASFALFEMKTVLQTVLREAELRPARRRAERVNRRAVTFTPARGGRIALTG